MDYRLNRITTDTGIVSEYVAYPEYQCPACGQASDYCQGHGEIGDPVGYAILEMHDTGNHTTCRYQTECEG